MGTGRSRSRRQGWMDVAGVLSSHQDWCHDRTSGPDGLLDFDGRHNRSAENSRGHKVIDYSRSMPNKSLQPLEKLGRCEKNTAFEGKSMGRKPKNAAHPRPINQKKTAAKAIISQT